MDYLIKPITEEYVQEFWSAVDTVSKERKYLAFLEAPPISSTYEYVANNIQYQWPHLIALDGNKLIGWCDIAPLDRPVFAHSGALGIGVLAPFRGQGVGKALIKAALDQAKEKGLTRIELTVREHNLSAVKLYQQFGFEIEGLHKNAVCIDGKYENHLSMALLF